MAGMLYLVPTPIGNLGDISQRCRETLEAADFIAAEDTRVSLKLLNHLGIKKSLVSYFEHNKAFKGEQIVQRILAGETCALVSDAGSPAISDPGEDLVKQCAAAGITVCAIPGPCAVITALSISGQATGRFCFESLKSEQRTMVFYEAPHKLLSTLEDMAETFGPDRSISLCRELTKLHEEVIRTTLGGAIEKYTQTPPKGEFVLVIAGAEPVEEEAATPMDAEQRLKQLLESGMSRKDAVKQTAKELELPKNTVYEIALKIPE